MISEDASDRGFLSASALLFAATAALTIAWCASMHATHGMPMPGGWTMSMTWMRMPGQSWLAAAAAFTGMWFVMMVAMMLPSLVPMLRRYRQSAARAGMKRLHRLTSAVGAGYFVVWTIFGAAIVPFGVALATVAMQRPALARAVPMAGAMVILVAGMLQFTTWKADRLACCREGSGSTPPSDPRAAWRYGLHLGMQCVCCCVDLTAILLVAGVMDLRVMAVVTVAITAERVAPAEVPVARAVGVVLVATGLSLIVRLAG